MVAALAAAVAGASLGFLYYNISPAMVFMGDAGSLLLGFTLAVVGIKYAPAELPLGSTWMVPIVVLGLPIFDTTLVTYARWRAHRHDVQGQHRAWRRCSSAGCSGRAWWACSCSSGRARSCNAHPRE